MNQLQTVYRNQHYQLERDNVHRRILDNTVDSIKITGAIKVGLVALLALIQLWIMKRFLKDDSDNTYQPV